MGAYAPKDRHEYRDAVLSEHGPSTSSARLVAVALTMRMDAQTLESFAGVELLATLSALSERTVRTALHVLKAEGWLEERRKGRGRDYALMYRRATLPPSVAAMVAGTHGVAAMVAGSRVPANGAANGARLAANGDASTGKKASGVPAMVATYPESDPEKDPGAASPTPAAAGSAALEPTREQQQYVRQLAAMGYKPEQLFGHSRLKGLTFDQVRQLASQGASIARAAQ